MAQITVMGIGNILLSDEGFGVRVIEHLQQTCTFPPSVQLLDGGTLGMEMLRFLRETTHLLVIDAIDGGGQGGDFYHFTGAEVRSYFQDKVSMHELGLKDMLAVMEVLGQAPEEVVVMGIQPQSLELGLELTTVAAGQLPRAVQAVLAQLASWQVEVNTHAAIDR